MIYEPLEIPSSGRRQVLRRSWRPETLSPDPTTLAFTLRQGVKWSDGKPFTASDVVFTFNLLKKNPALDTTGVWAQVSSVIALGQHGDHEVQVAERSVRRHGRAGRRSCRSTSGPVGDPTKYTNTKPVGTGPFTLETRSRRPSTR